METMKSMFFACALLLGSAETFSAENLVLSEDFESQTFPPSGWVVNSCFFCLGWCSLQSP